MNIQGNMINNNPILIIGDESVASGIFTHFTNAISNALERLGEKTVVYGRDCQTIEDLGELLEHPLKCIIGFQESFLCCEPVVEKRIKCFQFVFDNPFELNGTILKRNDDNYIALFSDRGYMEDAIHYLGKKNALFFPPGAAIESIGTTSVSERNIDIAFLGSYRQAPGIHYDWDDDFYRFFYEYMLEHPGKTFREGAEILLDMIGEKFDEVEFASLMQLLKTPCNLATGAYRGRVVDCLLESGIRLHVFGNSWDMYNGEYSERLIRHNAVPAWKATEIYKSAKISLNVMSWHRDGITERVLESMLCGAVCVSDETSEIKNAFVADEEIVLFSPEHPEEAAYKIRKLLSEPDWLEKIASGGRQRVHEEHTWDLRASGILHMLEE